MTLNWQQQTTSANSVFSAFSSKLLLRVIKVTDRMALADLISLSRSPPMWFTRGGFLSHLIQSACLLCRKASTLLWLNSSTVLANSFSAPTKVFRFWHLMDLTRSLLPIKYLKTSMNDSVSMLCCHFHIDCRTYQRSEKYSITLQGVSSFL